MKKKNQIAIINILSTIILRGISVFSSPVFSRLLGTSGYGVLNTFNTWVSVLAIVLTLETHSTLVNARVEYPEDAQREYQSSVMTMSVMFFLICASIITLLMKPISELLKLDTFLVVLILLQAFGSFSVNFLNSKFTYEFKPERNMLVSVGVAVSTIGFSLLFVLNMQQEYRYIGRILGNAIVYGLLGIGTAFFVLRQGKTRFHREYWKFSLMLAVPVVFHSLSDLLLGHSDLVMVRHMSGDSDAGIYALAYNFGNVMFTIFAALDNSWRPFFFEDMKNGKKQEVSATSRNYLELFTVLSAGFVLLVTEVYHIYARSDFWPGLPLMPLFVASYYLNFLCTFPVNYEYYHKKTGAVAIVTVVSAVLNIGLNWLFITWFGMIGAAAATLLSHCLQFLMHFIYARFCIRGEYVFGTFQWLPYAAVFAGVVCLVYLTPSLWYLRWGMGAALGIWELLQIKKRKSLF